MMSKGIYIVDLDGTIADCTHRLHYIKGKHSNYRKFFSECVNDTPIHSVITVVEALGEAGHRIVFLSGRSDEVQRQTFGWLQQYVYLRPTVLYMRKEGDTRPDEVIKPELLEQVKKDFPNEEILGFFDDRKRVVDVWRKMGYKVFHVAEGNF
jgi:phosphoglycolate phosphatase-like HAD superfamily hydrolase